MFCRKLLCQPSGSQGKFKKGVLVKGYLHKILSHRLWNLQQESDNCAPFLSCDARSEIPAICDARKPRFSPSFANGPAPYRSAKPPTPQKCSGECSGRCRPETGCSGKCSEKCLSSGVSSKNKEDKHFSEHFPEHPVSGRHLPEHSPEHFWGVGGFALL